MKSKQVAKRSVGYAAAQRVQNGMIVGLGTGSTAYFFIEKLIERHREEHLQIEVVATSKNSLELAKKGGLPLVDLEKLSLIDFTADGADEIDTKWQIIKGGGGALLREKVIASISSTWIVMIDETKKVDFLGKRSIPLEILPFAHCAIARQLEKKELFGKWRMSKGETAHKGFQQAHQETLFVTDNGHFILDLNPLYPLENPQELEQQIKAIPGILETGLFFQIPTDVLVGYSDGPLRGKVESLRRPYV